MASLAPLLRSFSYDEFWAELCSEPEDYSCSFWTASAIAKNMPNLRCLRLNGVAVFNGELEAILDGCPHLETLHLRSCKGLDLQRAGALEKRCRKQIKDLRLPIRFGLAFN